MVSVAESLLSGYHCNPMQFHLKLKRNVQYCILFIKRQQYSLGNACYLISFLMTTQDSILVAIIYITCTHKVWQNDTMRHFFAVIEILRTQSSTCVREREENLTTKGWLLLSTCRESPGIGQWGSAVLKTIVILTKERNNTYKTKKMYQQLR